MEFDKKIVDKELEIIKAVEIKKSGKPAEISEKNLRVKFQNF